MSRDRDTRIKPVIDHYVSRYKQRLGSDYAGRYGAAGRAIGGLPKSYTTEALLGLVDEFWDSPDPFVLEKSGARIEAWVQHLSAQLARKGHGADLGIDGLLRLAEERARR